MLFISVDTSERAAVCGNTEDIFDRWNSGAPYAYGSLTFSGSVGSASFKFTVRNTSGKQYLEQSFVLHKKIRYITEII